MSGRKLIFLIGLYTSLQLVAAQHSGPTPTACESLDNLLANTGFLQCTRNDACDTAHCNIKNFPFTSYHYSLTLSLLPCRDPPAIHVIVQDDDSGHTIVEKLFDHSETGIHLAAGTSMDITFEHHNNTIDIGASMTIGYSFFQRTITLLPRSTLTLNTSSCVTPDVLYAPASSPEPDATQGTDFPHLVVSVATANEITEVPTLQETTEVSTQAAISTATAQEFTTMKPTTQGLKNVSTQTISMPTIQGITEMPTSAGIPTTSGDLPTALHFAAGNETTCKVLTALSTFAETSNLFECVATEKELCDRVDYTAAELSRMNYTAEMVLLPCYNPPAIEISLRQNDKLLSSHVVSQSQEMIIPELFDLMLNVTLDHFPNAIGLQIVGKHNADRVFIIRYSIISLKEFNCPVENNNGETTSTAIAEFAGSGNAPSKASIISTALALPLGLLIIL